jgi:Questin oxidase-like
MTTDGTNDLVVSAMRAADPVPTIGGCAFEALLRRARESYSFEFIRENADGSFNTKVSNHLELCLTSLFWMGAEAHQLQRFYHAYTDYTPLHGRRTLVRDISEENWLRHLGDRKYEEGYRAFFIREVDRLGPAAALRAYLPVLIEGPGASAFHALIRTAFGLRLGNPTEIAHGLAYWATGFLSLGKSKGRDPITDDPAETLRRMRDDPAFRTIVHQGILFWTRMSLMGAEPAFEPVVDWLEIKPDTLAKIARTSLSLFATTGDMRALHAMTGAQALRWILPLLAAEVQVHAVRYLWQSIIALYNLMGYLPVPGDDKLDRLRSLTAPSWEAIFAAAKESNDGHDVKLPFVAWAEQQAYGDPLYRYAAALRLRMVPPIQMAA